MKTLAQRLRYCRERMGVSQSALARTVGIKPQAVQLIEAGRVEKPRHLLALATALGVNPTWLLEGDGPMAAMAVGETPARYGANLSAEATELARLWMGLSASERATVRTTVRALARKRRG